VVRLQRFIGSIEDGTPLCSNMKIIETYFYLPAAVFNLEQDNL
jgi:hypothetical protein